jgi:HEAT repeat protein
MSHPMPLQQPKRLSLEELQQLHRTPETIPERVVQILEVLDDPDEEVRAWAADCLSEIQQLDAAQAQKVAALCNHPNESVAQWACATLAKAHQLEGFQDLLVDALERHSSMGVRQSAVKSLGKLTKVSPRTVTALQQAAQASDARLQRLAKAALESKLVEQSKS